MTVPVRYRLKPQLVKQAKAVCDDLGLTPTQAVSMFFAQMVALRGLPFRPSTFAALEEYGATPEEADAAENRALKELKADRKAGKVVEFTGKFP